MTQPFDDEYGERLRRALHAEAEAVTPSAEGLERIRTKIVRRHERRIGWLSYSAPWLRPLAAVTAALVVCLAAVSVTPALANFVQTGHFSPDSSSDDGGNARNDGRSYGQMPPGESTTPAPDTTPSPSLSPSGSGKHVLRGTCPPGWNTVTPSTTPAPGDVADPNPTAQITCQAPPDEGNASSAPATEPATPPVSSQPEEPPSDPTTEAAPTTVPNQSP